MNKIRFDLGLYTVGAVERATRAFGELANIETVKTGDAIVCTVKECKYDPEETMNEFANYVLNATASGRSMDDGVY